MSVLADIFGSVRLNLDTGEFEVQAAKAADKTGASMGQRMGGKLGKALAGGIGAGHGPRVRRRPPRARSRSTRRWPSSRRRPAPARRRPRSSRSVADRASTRRNVQGIPEIGNTLTDLKLHFDLAGKAGREGGGRVPRLLPRRRQDAAHRGRRLRRARRRRRHQRRADDPFMDQLAASHQKYGVPIDDTIAPS